MLNRIAFLSPRIPGVIIKNPENSWSLTEILRDLAFIFIFCSSSNENTKETSTQLDIIWRLKRLEETHKNNPLS